MINQKCLIFLLLRVTLTHEWLMRNTPEHTWTAHVLAYLFFVTFCFIDSLQYFSCERDISTKIDAQDNGIKLMVSWSFLSDQGKFRYFCLRCQKDLITQIQTRLTIIGVSYWMRVSLALINLCWVPSYQTGKCTKHWEFS